MQCQEEQRVLSTPIGRSHWLCQACALQCTQRAHWQIECTMPTSQQRDKQVEFDAAAWLSLKEVVSVWRNLFVCITGQGAEVEVHRRLLRVSALQERQHKQPWKQVNSPFFLAADRSLQLTNNFEPQHTAMNAPDIPSCPPFFEMTLSRCYSLELLMLLLDALAVPIAGWLATQFIICSTRARSISHIVYGVCLQCPGCIQPAICKRRRGG